MVIFMENNEIKISHSKANMVSYSFGTFLNEFVMMAFFAFTFFFYESEIGLDVWLVAFGYILFAIWNAVNDPIVGYLTDKPFKFTKKWGRRFPWLMLGGFPWAISYILVFMPPAVDPNTQQGALILVVWFVISMCLFDTFASIFWVNYASLFPDKFRSTEERRTANGFSIFIGVFGTVSGAVVPPLFITFGVLSSYIIAAGVVMLVGIIAVILLIPGGREEQALIDQYLVAYPKREKSSFFKTLKAAMKHRNFIVVILVLLLYQVMIRSMTASIPFIVRFILKMEASVITVIMGLFMISVLISTPIWVKIAQKKNDNRKITLITGILLTIFTIPMIFVNTYLGFILGMLLWGTVLGGFWVTQLWILSDSIDEAVCETEKREEGIYNGINQFFSRIALVVQALSFAIIHELTGFVEGADTQSAQAVIGIHIHFAVVPLIAMIIGMIIFWKWYDLTPERVKENQQKMKELCL